MAFFRNLLSAKSNQAAVLAAQKGGMVTVPEKGRLQRRKEGSRQQKGHQLVAVKRKRLGRTLEASLRRSESDLTRNETVDTGLKIFLDKKRTIFMMNAVIQQFLPLLLMSAV
jgi:hypothetical protein